MDIMYYVIKPLSSYQSMCMAFDNNVYQSIMCWSTCIRSYYHIGYHSNPIHWSSMPTDEYTGEHASRIEINFNSVHFIYKKHVY